MLSQFWINRRKIKTEWGPPVSLTVQTEAPRPSPCPHPRLCCHCSCPPFPPTVSVTMPPSSTALHGIKRSASPKELLLSSSSVHASPLLSSPFTSATPAPDVNALECPSNNAEQEHRPHAALLPQADRCEGSPKPPHIVRHFH
jgi:hypothetical protein